MSSDKEVGVSVVPQPPQIEAVNGVTWYYFGSSFHVRPNIEIASAIMSITGFVSESLDEQLIMSSLDSMLAP